MDEALRFYNRTRAQYPRTPLALIAEDVGHQRSQNKSADVQLRDARVFDWFARYVKGDKSVTPLATGSVEALTEACGAPSAGPFITPNWVAQHPGEVRFDSVPGQTFTSAGGDPNVARTIDPIAGGGACATTSASDEPDTANWSLPAATGNGYTLLGAPTVIADVAVSGEFPEVAERLWDVRAVTRRWWRAGCTGPTRAAGRSSSCTRAPGTSRPGTCPSCSCWAATLPTAALPTGPSRSPCRTCSCASRSTSRRTAARC